MKKRNQTLKEKANNAFILMQNTKEKDDLLNYLAMLNRTIKAYKRLCLAYRSGQPKVPEWVFKNIESYNKETLKTDVDVEAESGI